MDKEYSSEETKDLLKVLDEPVEDEPEEINELSIDIDSYEDKKKLSKFSLFTDNQKNVIRLVLKYPGITQTKIAKISGLSSQYVWKIMQNERIREFISDLQLGDVQDIIKLNFIASQIATSKNLKSDDEKVRCDAIKVANSIYEKFYKDKLTKAESEVSSSNDDITLDITPNI